MINLNTLYQFLTTTASDVVFVNWRINPLTEYFKQQGWGEDFAIAKIRVYLPKEIKLFYSNWCWQAPMLGRQIAKQLKQYEKYAD